MIIKKGKQQIVKKKDVPQQSSFEEPKQTALSQETIAPTQEVVVEEPIIEEPIEDTPIEEPVEEPQNQKVDIFADFNFDEINYTQRAERRRGDRRRGYRRIDDRNLISRAQQEAINIKEQAAREGYEKGMAEAGQAVDGIKNALNEFFEYKNKVYEQVSEDFLEVAIKIAEKIIKKEVESDKKVLDAIVHDAIGNLAKGENKIILKVNPTDVEYTKEIVPNLLSSGQFEAKIYVSGDKEVDEGSVIIETSNGVIDATISTQLELIKEAFKQI